MKGWLNFNGSLVEEGRPLITAGSMAFRYGDGLFETMRATDGQLRLKELHFQRLFEGIELLQIKTAETMNAAYLEEQVVKTIAKNNMKGQVRVRLSVFRGEGEPDDPENAEGQFVIQIRPLPARTAMDEDGLVVGAYQDATKGSGGLANVKSNNYLIYVLSRIYARKNGWHECLVMNDHHRVCDATTANVFWIKDRRIFTPPLSEGCVAGVMRRHLLAALPGNGFPVYEAPATLADLHAADELFVTNAIRGIRWVKQLDTKIFDNALSRQLLPSTF